MSFLSKLKGHKRLGTVRIHFYGQDEASVKYETTADADWENDLSQLFALYYANMLYNLNSGDLADSLIAYIGTAADTAFANLPEKANIMPSGQNLVDSKPVVITKSYSSELLEKSDGSRYNQTHMDWVGEGYYIPTSTVMFLQHVINRLSEESLRFLLLALKGMNHYYDKIGDYVNAASSMEAVNYGFAVAAEAISSAGSTGFDDRSARDAKIWLKKGLDLAKSGKYAEAIVAYDGAIEINTNYAKAWQNKGFALSRLEKYEEAITACNRAIELNPNDAKAWHTEGFALSQLERYEQAISAYDRAIELKPNDIKARQQKGIVLVLLERQIERSAGQS